MESDYVPPPPAYSEQEFDQKISQATALSLLTPIHGVDADGWQRYDSSAFQRTPAQSSGLVSSNTVNSSASLSSSSKSNSLASVNHQSSSQNDSTRPIRSLPSIVPLRIEKKSQQQYGSSKADQISLDAKPVSLSQHTPSKSIASSSSTVPISSNVYCNEITARKHQNTPVNYSISPPSFERTSSYVPSVLAAEQTYPGIEEDAFDPYRDFQASQPPGPHPAVRQSLPVTPRPHSAIQRPASHTRSRSEATNSPSMPRVQFDPSVAYGKVNLAVPMTAIQAIHSSLPPSIRPDVHYNAHSFYNSSVSSKMVATNSSQGVGHCQTPTYDQANRQAPSAQQFHPLRTGQQPQSPSSWQSPSRPTPHYPNIPNNPRPASLTDSSRFSQYSNDSSRDSVYSTQNDWYPSR